MRVAGYDRREMSGWLTTIDTDTRETEKNLLPLGEEWQAEDVMRRICELFRRFYCDGGKKRKMGGGM